MLDTAHRLTTRAAASRLFSLALFFPHLTMLDDAGAAINTALYGGEKRPGERPAAHGIPDDRPLVALLVVQMPPASS